MKGEMKFINNLKNFTKDFGGNTYLVGGFVREKLINGNAHPKDIDVVYDGDIDELLKYLNENGYKLFKTEKGLDIYGIIEDDITINISTIKGGSIEEDLSRRDFSINAIGLKLLDNKIIDPFRGRKAIQCRIIQQVNERSIEEDPIRILRGIKFYIKHGMHFNLETENNIVDSVEKLNECEKTNIVYELMSIIEIDKYGKAFELLDDYKILPQLIPYINELKNIEKFEHCVEDRFAHMNLTYSVFKDIINGRMILDQLDLKLFEHRIDNFKIKEYISLSAFLNDIGKIKAYEKEEDKISFLQYGKNGLDIVKHICNELAFSKESIDLMENMVQGCMCILGLFKANIINEHEDFHKFLDKYNKYVPYILTVSFCDVYATNMLSSCNDEKDQYTSFIERLLVKYRAYNNIDTV